MNEREVVDQARQLTDAGTTDHGRPYFVMELVQGVPLAHFTDQQHSSSRERLELFVPICHAVQHAHQEGLLHPIMKPSHAGLSIRLQ